MANEPDASRQDRPEQVTSPPASNAPEGTVPVGSLYDSSPAVTPSTEIPASTESTGTTDPSTKPALEEKGAKPSGATSSAEIPPLKEATPESEHNSQSDYGEYYDYGSSNYSEDQSHSSSDSSSEPSSAVAVTGGGGGGSDHGSTGDGNQENGDGATEDEEGGPIKSFLEHLEDLRWVIVKCSIALLVGMMICLFGVNYVVAILTWPLHRAGQVSTSLVAKDTTVNVGVTANDQQILWQFKSDTNVFAGLNLGSNQAVILKMTTVIVSNQPVLALMVDDKSPLIKKVSIGPKLVYLDPAAPFISSLYIAFFGGMLLAAPFLFFYLGQYIMPALRWKEKKYLLRAFFVGLFLFLLGVSLCYFVILPLALRAAEQYSLWMGIEAPQWRAEMYFSFACKFMMGMGLGFEMPVILLALVKIGLLNYKKLAGFRRYMIVVNLILGALLTTPEVLTQVAMFIPLQLLYEITIWIAWYWERQARKKAEAEAASQPPEP